MSTEITISKREVQELDTIAKSVIAYSEDDRRKADQLFAYYQELIASGDTKGETREAMAKALQLKEESVGNLIEIMKLKSRLIEKKLQLEMKAMSMEESDFGGGKGHDTTKIISSMEDVDDV